MYKHLTREQRYAIYLGRQSGETLEMIARSIGVSRSTVSWELGRNSTAGGRYVLCKAHELSESRQRRTPGNRGLDGTLVWRIKELIRNEQWSPRQISGRLAKEGISVSHETLYAIIRKDSTGELAAQCRHKIRYRRSPPHRHGARVTNIKNRTGIHERAAEADGKRFGDWEMDLVVDKDSNAILTLVERSTTERGGGELEQTGKAVHTGRNEHKHRYVWENKENQNENQCQTERKNSNLTRRQRPFSKISRNAALAG